MGFKIRSSFHSLFIASRLLGIVKWVVDPRIQFRTLYIFFFIFPVSCHSHVSMSFPVILRLDSPFRTIKSVIFVCGPSHRHINDYEPEFWSQDVCHRGHCHGDAHHHRKIASSSISVLVLAMKRIGRWEEDDDDDETTSLVMNLWVLVMKHANFYEGASHIWM